MCSEVERIMKVVGCYFKILSLGLHGTTDGNCK
jgi:hypothetical protein